MRIRLLLLFQLIEDVTIDLVTGPIVPIFSTEAQVLREQLSYTELTFTAEVGGVLGLFFGFNFLMVWDWIVWWFHRFSSFVTSIIAKLRQNQ